MARHPDFLGTSVPALRPDAVLPMVRPLCLLNTHAVSLAGPHPDLLATAGPVVADPHHGLRTMVGSPHPNGLDHPPASAGLGEDGVGVLVHCLGHARVQGTKEASEI
jgi:hypothetical protein